MKKITKIFGLLVTLLGLVLVGCSFPVTDVPENTPIVDETDEGETTTANYTVKHLQQNLNDDGYTEVTADTQTLSGAIGAQTVAVAKTYTGFTAQDISQQTISADGTTVVEIKYNRNPYTVSYGNTSGENLALPNSTSVKYGTKITVNPADYLNSTVAYITWSDGTNEYNTNGNNDAFEITVTKDITLTAKELWFKAGTPVEFYYKAPLEIYSDNNFIKWKEYFKAQDETIKLQKDSSKIDLLRIFTENILSLRKMNNGETIWVLGCEREFNQATAFRTKGLCIVDKVTFNKTNSKIQYSFNYESLSKTVLLKL